MKLADAQKIAERVCGELRPWCARIAIAGSVRRKKPEVGDIEIVAIPIAHTIRDLFGTEVMRVRDPRFIAAASCLGRIVKGDIACGRYVRIELPEGIALDLFIANHDNWGLILAIRTGSAEFSHRVLACGWVSAGYHSMDGMLCTKFHKVRVREEEDLFGLIGIPWTAPEAREI